MQLKLSAVRAVSLAAVASVSCVAGAQEVNLKAHTLVPAGATGVARLIVPWCDKVGKESGGRIKCQVFPSMQLGGTPLQLYDQAKDGVVDLTWTVLGYTPGRFPALEVFELPFMTKTSKGSSRAFWEYAAVNGLLGSELRDVKPLALHVHDRGLIHTASRPVKTLEDFKGLKLRAPTRLTSRMLAAFGASAVGIPAPQVPEALSKGVIDGAVFPWEIVPSLRLHELVKFHTELDPKSRNLYSSSFIFAMNKSRYEGLPPELRKVIDENSGGLLAERIGAVWDESAGSARQLAVKRGNGMHTVSAAEIRKWQAAAQPVIDGWVSEVSAKGLKGAELLQSARAQINKFDGD